MIRALQPSAAHAGRKRIDLAIAAEVDGLFDGIEGSPKDLDPVGMRLSEAFSDAVRPTKPLDCQKAAISKNGGFSFFCGSDHDGARVVVRCVGGVVTKAAAACVAGASPRSSSRARLKSGGLSW